MSFDSEEGRDHSIEGSDFWEAEMGMVEAEIRNARELEKALNTWSDHRDTGSILVERNGNRVTMSLADAGELSFHNFIAVLVVRNNRIEIESMTGYIRQSDASDPHNIQFKDKHLNVHITPGEELSVIRRIDTDQTNETIDPEQSLAYFNNARALLETILIRSGVRDLKRAAL